MRAWDLTAGRTASDVEVSSPTTVGQYRVEIETNPQSPVVAHVVLVYSEYESELTVEEGSGGNRVIATNYLKSTSTASSS